MKRMAMVGCCLFAAVAGAGELDGWSRKVELTLGANLAPTEITTGVPTLVRLSETRVSGFSYKTFSSQDGSDLLFVHNGTVVPHEVDTWDVNGESLVWVKLPSTAQGTTLTMLYGRETAPTDRSAAVWEGYEGVWHLNEDSAGLHDTVVHDSTTNHYDGTAYTGNANAKGQTVEGKLGSGWQISTATGSQAGGIIIDSMTNATLGTQFTVSGWLWHKKNSYNFDHVCYRKAKLGDGNGFASEMNTTAWGDGKIRIAGSGGQSSMTPSLTNAVNGGWAHIAISYDEKKARLVNNGVAGNAIDLNGTPTDNGKAIAFGNNSSRGDVVWTGTMDELRIRLGAFDANFAAAEYKAMNVEGEDLFVFSKPIPPSTDDKVTVEFVNGSSSQKYVAMSDGDPVVSGGLVWTNAAVVVTVTPGKSYAYPTAPTGWTKRGAKIVRTFQATTDPTTIVIPEAEIEPDFVGWKKKVTVSLAAALADTEITEGLPTLVRLSEETVEGFRYDDFKRDDGADLVFVAGGLRLPHEVDTWNPGGESLVWVRLPSTAQGTSFTMCYGRAEPPTDMSAAVWEGYAGVWHLNENSNGTHDTTVHDSTANGYDGTAYTGSANAKGQTVQGMLGNGWQISAATKSQDGGILIGSMKNATLGTSFTVSGWLWHKSDTYFYDHIFYRKNALTDGEGFASEMDSGGGWNSGSVKIAGGGGAAIVKPGLTNAVNGGWAHIAIAYDNTDNTATARLICNGVASTAASVTAPTDNGKAIAFGVDSDKNDANWCGMMDELRIRTGAFDANFAAAEYKAMNVGDDDIFAFGKAEEFTPGLILFLR